MPTETWAMIDAVGILGGGGREVALDLTHACLSEATISGILLCSGDPALLEAFDDFDNVRKLDVRDRGYAWRVGWWFGGAVRTARRRGCSAVLHIGNVAVGPGRGVARGVMVHQSNALDLPTSSRAIDLSSLRYRTLRRLITMSVRQADAVFVQTTAVANAVRELGARTEITVAPPASPASLPPPSPDCLPADTREHRILYVGSDAPHKNVRLLMETARRYEGQMAGAHLVVSLPTPDAPTPGVLYLGALTRQQVADELERACALVMPSLQETAGLPMLEAMQRGVPVLAADRAYARAICDEAAVYFDPMDAGSLAEACRSIVENDVRREDLIRAGFARIAELEDARGDRKMAMWLAEAANRTLDTGASAGP